jgi:YHS domain-containing protein
MRFMQSAVKLVIAITLMSQATLAAAIDPYFSTKEGAIQGYDPVAYFADQKAVKGDPAFHLDWQGATWYFASAAHRDAFRAEPEKFAPQFGGYCSFGVAHGYAPQTDPTAFAVVDGKLYLNYNHTVREKWNEDRENYVLKANQNWPGLKASTPK